MMKDLQLRKGLRQALATNSRVLDNRGHPQVHIRVMLMERRVVGPLRKSLFRNPARSPYQSRSCPKTRHQPNSSSLHPSLMTCRQALQSRPRWVLLPLSEIQRPVSRMGKSRARYPSIRVHHPLLLVRTVSSYPAHSQRPRIWT